MTSGTLINPNPSLIQNRAIILCPGIHDPHLTDDFMNGLVQTEPNLYPFSNWLVFPTDQYPAYSPFDILNFIYNSILTRSNSFTGFHLYQNRPIEVPLIFMSFSAGVVGAIGAAWAWQQQGGSVEAFIALDGWGVPLLGNFPIYRISHDSFTHWSSGFLGTGKDNFYAEPSVAHLDLWRSPQTTQGQWVHHSETGSITQSSTTAALFLVHLLRYHSGFISEREPF